MKKMMLLLLMLAVSTAAFAGSLAFDDFNSYTPGDDLLTKTGWTELFASDNPVVDSNEVYTGMGNSVSGLNDNAYASAKLFLGKPINLGSDQTYVTGLMSVPTIESANDEGLFLGFADANTDKLEVRFYKNRNQILVTGQVSTISYNLPANTFEAGKTYLCVVKTVPEVGATSCTLYVGVAEFTGYPLSATEITYQVTRTGVAPTSGLSFSNALWYPRGDGFLVDHAFAGETWADVQDPQPYTLPGPMIGYWAMDECSGTVTADMSGYGNDATATGPIVKAVGKVATGTDLNGEYYNIPSIPEMTSAPSLSVATWVKAKSLDGGYKGVVMTRGVQDGSGSGQNWGLAIEADHFEMRVSGAGIDAAAGTVTVDQWYHVAMVYDGSASQSTLYIDGQPAVGPVATSGIGSILSSGSWQIGTDTYSPGARIPDAVIDEVSIWNTALTPEDVNSLYTDALSGIATDGSTPILCPNVIPEDWINPATLTTSDVLFSKEPGLGKGGFEDLFDYEQDHPDTEAQPYFEPFRIFCEGFEGDGSGNVDPALNPNGDWCSIDDGGWVLQITAQINNGDPAGWETSKYSPTTYPNRSYNSDSHLIVQDDQRASLTSNYAIALPTGADALAVGQNLVIEWFSYMIPGAADPDIVYITPTRVFDQGLGSEYKAEVGTVDEPGTVYTRRTLDWTVDATAAAASTIDLEFDLFSQEGQLRMDAIQVIRAPQFTINEGAPGNVATIPIKLLVDPGQDVTLTVSTSSLSDAPVKYTTDGDQWQLLADVTVSELTFTAGGAGNWNVEQDLLVTSIDNATMDGDRRLTFQIADPNTSLDPNILPSVDFFVVDVIDDEWPRLILSDVADLAVGEKGAGTPGTDTDTFSLALGGLSTSNVVITLTDEPNEVNISPNPIVFTPAEINASTPKLITVTAIADDGPETLIHNTAITFSAAPESGQPTTEYLDNFSSLDVVLVDVYDADCGSDGHVPTILDVTGDCVVDMDDFAYLALRWLDCYTPNEAGCIDVR